MEPNLDAIPTAPRLRRTPQAKKRAEIPDSPFLLKLEKKWAEGKLLCVGLDPVLENIPAEFKGDRSIEDTLFDFNRTIIDATAHTVCAFKPNLAFYEEHDEQGRRALARTIAYIQEHHPDIVIILDSKRGDIGKTNERYARADLDRLNPDAITLQSYFGGESLKPFLDRTSKGHIILTRTSNPKAGDIQDTPLRGQDRTVANRVARLAAEEWNKNGTIALVVGATVPEHLATIRAIVGDVPVLAPGIGTQGGDLERTVRAGADSRGMGLVINVSSGISEAKRIGTESVAEAAQRTAEKYRDDISKALILPRIVAGAVDLTNHPEGFTTAQEELLLAMFEHGMFKTGEFSIKYHASHPDCPHKSPVYMDLRMLRRFPKAKLLAAEVYEEMLANLDFDLLADVPTGATPLTSTIADNLEIPMVTPRTDKKSHGSGATVDGFITAQDTGKVAALIEDVATTGGSTLEAAKLIRQVRAEVTDALVLVDREQGAREKLAKEGITLHAAFTLDRMFAFYVRSGKLTQEKVDGMKAKLATLQAYMDTNP